MERLTRAVTFSVLLVLVLCAADSWQQESFFFQSPSGGPKGRQFPSHFQQQPQPSGPFHSAPDQFQFQGFQPSSFGSPRHQPSPFIKSPSGGFLSDLQVQPLPPQSQFAQRHPSSGSEQFLGQVTLQSPNEQLLHSNSFPFDISAGGGFNKPRFTSRGAAISSGPVPSNKSRNPTRAPPQPLEHPFNARFHNNNISGRPFATPSRAAPPAFASQERNSAERFHTQAQTHLSNGRAPFTSQERNNNRFASPESDRLFGETQRKGRPFTVPTLDQGKDYDYEAGYAGLRTNAATAGRFKPKPTDTPPVTTHRNTDAYLRSQAFVNTNRKPFDYRQHVGGLVDEKKISITTHSAFGNLQDAELEEATPPGEDYYDEDEEELHHEEEEEEEEQEPNQEERPDHKHEKPSLTNEHMKVKDLYKVDDVHEKKESLKEKEIYKIPKDKEKESHKVEEQLQNEQDSILNHEVLNDKLEREIYKDNNNASKENGNLPKEEEEIAVTTVAPTTLPARNTTTGFEVLTMSPVTMVENDNFKEFVDSGLIDNTEMLAVLDLADHATNPPAGDKKLDEENRTEAVNYEPAEEIEEIDEEEPTEDEIHEPVDSTDENEDDEEHDQDVVHIKDEIEDPSISHHENVNDEPEQTHEENEELPQNDQAWEEEISITEKPAVLNESHKKGEEKEDVVMIHEIVSVVTTKSVINGTISVPVTTPTPVTEQMPSSKGDKPSYNENNNFNNGTEGWLVVGSVQTSRSVSQVKPVAEPADEEKTDVDVIIQTTDKPADITTESTLRESTISLDTAPEVTSLPSTESIIDKLDQLQSELSSGFLTRAFNNISDNIAVLTDMQHLVNASSATPVPVAPEQSQHPPVIIRKFVPNSRTTTTTHRPRHHKPVKVESKEDVELASLLPPGFKPRAYNRKTTTNATPVKPLIPDIKHRNGTTGRSLGQSHQNNKITVQDVITSDLKPKNNKSQPTLKETDLEKLLGGAKQVDISALLPPGYKPEQVTTKIEFKDVSGFLPPGYTTPKTEEKEEEAKDSKDDSLVGSLLKNLNFKDVSNLLPPGYNASTEKPAEKTTERPPSGGLKVVFPSRPGGRKPLPRPGGANRPVGTAESSSSTTPRTSTLRAWPSRSTTEFTGWPSPSTTPLSIEKLLELQRTQQVAMAGKGLLPEGYDPNVVSGNDGTSSTTTTTTTEPTTTSTTTHAPGVCENECSLVGTIRLIGGTVWVPELLDHHTKEWQLLANEVQTQLEDAFSKSATLKQWYRKIRIDGFSEGSVLVDYFVELTDLPGHLDTLEVKRIFHAALSPAPGSDDFDEEEEENTQELEYGKPEMPKLSLGKFVVDPTYTDFIVLPKIAAPTVGFAEDDVLLPQWAIAVVVIGLASLCFVIIFGVTVLVNKQKNNQKKSKAVPLTEDMLQELNKNHMGGLDNYGAEDLYNVNLEDQWNQPYVKQSKRPIEHDNSTSNLYDSWRSQWTRPSPQLHAADLFRDPPVPLPRGGPHSMMAAADHYHYGDLRGHETYMGGSHYRAGYQRRRSDYDTNF